jgi:hypothetical protein
MTDLIQLSRTYPPRREPWQYHHLFSSATCFSSGCRIQCSTIIFIAVDINFIRFIHAPSLRFPRRGHQIGHYFCHLLKSSSIIFATGGTLSLVKNVRPLHSLLRPTVWCEQRHYVAIEKFSSNEAKCLPEGIPCISQQEFSFNAITSTSFFSVP